ncbi:hypothetical protein FE257_007252 [Aspergillus nanangensis]|uniref:Uncharacterized protein n=1 Tax=Aspergillus nanangensis TaxID=2582783 RepID=A0AAD4GUA7_ASPNN|nr:hypothetical protein FE257_007252 [Aspergillus nanangensis]
MADNYVEVPLILSPDVNLSYEDIAKLNPFYEECRAFWNTSPDDMSTNASSRSSSLQSLRSHIDAQFSPLNHPIVPPLHLHSGSQCKPSFDVRESRIHSQIAILEYDGHFKGASSPLKESSEYDRLSISALEHGLIENPLTQPKTSHKKLFGSNGWLGCTANLEALPNISPVSKPRTTLKSLGKRIRQQVGSIAEDMAKAHYPHPFGHPSHRFQAVSEASIPVSLDPPAQAKLYSELEVMICVSANKFLVDQYNIGRLSAESIRKIKDFWGSKNRPQVVEFQFDQSTQRRLILSNIRTLHFNGESSTNPVLLHSNLQNWRAIAKEMTVRTFCSRDSVIRKHMHDIHKLLDMLGAPVDTFLAFQELQVRTLAAMKEHLEKDVHARRSATSATP